MQLIPRIIAVCSLGFAACVCLVTGAEPPAAQNQIVAVIRLNGVINPVSANYVENALKKALEDHRAAVLIELDTPGGLLDATRSIVSAMISAEIPVIVYVGPRGARATSAGVFITMASDIAAMAPETHLGAAHPVNVGGGDVQMSSTSVMSEKAVSDASAYIRTLALERKRNASWAERAVRESVSLTGDEALQQNVIEIMAADRQDLFAKLNGRTVEKSSKTYTLALKNATTVDYEMTSVQRVLQRIAHPNIAYILMTVGVYGLIYELAAPGIGLGGVVGVICLLLAFFSLQILPINIVGVILIVAGFVMLALELINPTHGLLTFGGLLAFAFGSFFLIDTDISPIYTRVSLELIAGVLAATALFFGIGLKKALEARRVKPKTGAESLIGKEGTANTDIAPTGMVYLNGELWTAESSSTIESGSSVRIVRVNGNKIFVEKI